MTSTLQEVASQVPGAIKDAVVGEITIAGYILARLKQLDVTHLMGVPGDFNLRFLDYVEDDKDIQWAGNCNELNAAYAADGYSRSKNGALSVLTTTFGVGELSAVNGVAGAFSERIPMLHIAGVPSTRLQAHRALLHHTLGDGRFNAFIEMNKQITMDQGILMNARDAAETIDRVLSVAMHSCRPTYLTLPTDLVDAKIPATPLSTPVKPPAPDRVSFTSADPMPSENMAPFIVSEISRLYQTAKNPIVLIDACTIRFGLQSLALQLVEATGMRFYTSPMGKGALNETHPAFGGIYIGSTSLPNVKECVETSDLVFNIGGLKSDFNSGGFSYHIEPVSTIAIHSDHTKIQFATYENIRAKQLMPQLISTLKAMPKKPADPARAKLELAAAADRAEANRVVTKEEEGTDAITQRHFWPRIGRFLQPHDVLVAETGTSNFGLIDIDLAQGVSVVSQILWGSIGWSVGAAFGAAIGARELERKDGKERRTCLFVGDGSLQLTVQELSSMIRHKLTPILFVLNNDGYEIERQIHGPQRRYNDIAMWRWTKILSALSPPEQEDRHASYTVKTKDELDTLLRDESFLSAKKVRLVEVILPRGDAPRVLKKQAEITAQANAD